MGTESPPEKGDQCGPGPAAEQYPTGPFYPWRGAWFRPQTTLINICAESGASNPSSTPGWPPSKYPPPSAQQVSLALGRGLPTAPAWGHLGVALLEFGERGGRRAGPGPPASGRHRAAGTPAPGRRSARRVADPSIPEIADPLFGGGLTRGPTPGVRVGSLRVNAFVQVILRSALACHGAGSEAVPVRGGAGGRWIGDPPLTVQDLMRG